MIRVLVAAFSFASVACGPPGDGSPPPVDLAPDAGLGPGAVCLCNDECQSGNCEKLFVCDKDRAVSCSRDRNDCAANGLPGSACVEERSGTCSPFPSAGQSYYQR